MADAFYICCQRPSLRELQDMVAALHICHPCLLSDCPQSTRCQELCHRTEQTDAQVRVSSRDLRAHRLFELRGRYRRAKVI